MPVDPIRMTTSLESLAADRLWPKLNLADAAHLKALREAKALTPELEKSAKAALHLLSSMDPAGLNPAGGDLFDQRKTIVRDRLNVPAGWMSLGRARREAVTLAFHLALREDFAQLRLDLCSLLETLAELSRKHAETLFADFTYLIPSQPSTFGHYLNAVSGPLLRCQNTAVYVAASLNQSPAGGGSTNGSRVPISRENLARDLGFDGVVENTRDAVWRSDLIHETASLLSTIALAISRLTNDLLFFSSPSLGYVAFEPQMQRKSWILPQKNNPYVLAMLRGICSEIAVLPQSVWMWNHTSTNQPDNRVHSHHQILAGVKRASESLSLMNAILLSMSVDTPRMESACESFSIRSADIAELLAMQGLDYEMASECVREALSSGGDIEKGLEKALLKKGVKANATDALKSSDPSSCIQAKPQTGSCSPQQVRGLAAAQLQRCAEMRKSVELQRERMLQAEKSLAASLRGEN